MDSVECFVIFGDLYSQKSCTVWFMWNQIVSIFMVETTSNESDPFPPAGIKNDL